MFEFNEKGDLVMARTSKAKSAVDQAIAGESAVAQTVDQAIADESAVAQTVAAEENMDVNEEEIIKEKPVENKVSVVAPLEKDDEIEVISLIPNVSYKDSHTGDMYKWEDAGQIEAMPFDVVQRMWQKHKNYFKSMWLKPLDDRVVKKFGLTGTYDKYEFLMDESNYTKANIDKICDSISSTPSALKLSLCNKVKSMVASGQVSDIAVIRAMEKNLKIDLIPLVG